MDAGSGTCGSDLRVQTRLVVIPIIWLAHERSLRLAVAGPVSMIRNIRGMNRAARRTSG